MRKKLLAVFGMLMAFGVSMAATGCNFGANSSATSQSTTSESGIVTPGDSQKPNDSSTPSGPVTLENFDKIGRASCRERVSIDV